YAVQLVLLTVILLVMILLVTGLGYIKMSPGEVARIILGRLFNQKEWLTGIDPAWPYVVLQVRLPRILTSAAVGAGLATAGTIFQGLLLNPLADPYTLGVSAGAAFGAALALLLGLGAWGPYAVTTMAFICAAATLAVVIALAVVDGQIQLHSLILSGVIVAAILSAGISFIKYLADEQVSIIIFWLLGSFVARTWVDLGLTAPLVAISLICGLFWASDLNIISLGQRSAAALGVETTRVRLILLATASLATAACVSVSGIIGFVGLIVPHLMRHFTGPDNRRLLPASALTGAILLLAADTTARAVLPGEVPVGVLTALIGGPVFCYVYRRKQLRTWYA
ncbi:MAG: iron ABC transporter permease, partial [Deltaproteobacteria bacterium]|nr:iron ABC transporter permease [Deltaproteobacteria bacterium]